MTKIINVIHFLASSSIFIALNGLILILFSFLLYDLPLDFFILLCSFLLTFSIYSMNKTTDMEEDRWNNPRRFELVKGNMKTWKLLSFASLIASLLIASLKGPQTLLILLVPILASFLYSCKLCRFFPRLKEIAGVKSLTVATSWAFVGSLLPTTVGGVPFSTVLFNFSFIFITLFVNTVLFDVRDVYGDIASDIRTIPTSLGIVGTEKLLFFADSLLIFWMTFSPFIFNEFIMYNLLLAFNALYGFLLIKIFCRENQKRLLQEVLVDGEWIPIIVILIVLKCFF